MDNRPYVLTIAGLDPSSGAGITADIKAMEALKCYGLSVCTANTVQNDVSLKAVYWTPLAVILEQIDILFERFTITVVKIGVVENWTVLNSILTLLHQKNKGIKIVLDPVLSSSTSYCFHDSDTTEFYQVLEKIYLLTPNYLEVQDLFPDRDIAKNIAEITQRTNLLLKGGHHPNRRGEDVLYLKNDEVHSFLPKVDKVFPKHGSGCVLSSYIASYLALGQPLHQACEKAKINIESFLNSNSSLLGYH
ncbi:hydroxymethylpyrimidine/phosphomethylpyrimidine kinase [Arenibacter sp. 6A1]|uniref:hydroxymethylpyrimidine/phosphomethylpyrimidine kinase n=1 Tax=Arenibacter sp. 6A1 TaxID=2720391 RepID=UPI001447118B|nr:hydroxymethylpyrimidine/phosphomethylpyrimidine kinase [Arenibacter sp. 6A1]NKI25128.1 hydroxymethylpyrimidine/phosphomethylpyrimidine kinase [Arenibacter sp. 6A1]